MHRWMARAAGGISHLLKFFGATIAERVSMEATGSPCPYADRVDVDGGERWGTRAEVIRPSSCSTQGKSSHKDCSGSAQRFLHKSPQIPVRRESRTGEWAGVPREAGPRPPERRGCLRSVGSAA